MLANKLESGYNVKFTIVVYIVTQELLIYNLYTFMDIKVSRYRSQKDIKSSPYFSTMLHHNNIVKICPICLFENFQ